MQSTDRARGPTAARAWCVLRLDWARACHVCAIRRKSSFLPARFWAYVNVRLCSFPFLRAVAKTSRGLHASTARWQSACCSCSFIGLTRTATLTLSSVFGLVAIVEVGVSAHQLPEW